MRRFIEISMLMVAGFFISSNLVAADVAIDPKASFLGPFDAASNFDEIAQEFVVSATGLLSSLEAFVPTIPGLEESYEFGWELRDATTFNYETVNIDDLPVLHSGNAWSNATSPEDPYDSAPVLLFSDLDLPVAEGQRFILLVKIINIDSWTAMWIGGAGQLPGEAFMRKGNPETWLWVHLPGTEFGRIVRLDLAVASERLTWGEIKTLYR